METLDQKYQDELDTLRGVIQGSETLATYLEDEEEASYQALRDEFEPQIERCLQAHLDVFAQNNCSATEQRVILLEMNQVTSDRVDALLWVTLTNHSPNSFSTFGGLAPRSRGEKSHKTLSSMVVQRLRSSRPRKSHRKIRPAA